MNQSMRLWAVMLGLLLVVAGCGGGGSGGGASTPILTSFKGAWAFDLNKTLAHWKSKGMSSAEIARMQSLHKVFPLHRDVEITDQGAILPGLYEGEYIFFSLHTHTPWVCGKAWHHEDRHDPGDMSKCYVRMEVIGSDLYLSIRMQDGLPSASDPDLKSLPVTGGSAGTCGADTAPSPPWSPWTTYVFVRPPTDD